MSFWIQEKQDKAVSVLRVEKPPSAVCGVYRLRVFIIGRVSYSDASGIAEKPDYNDLIGF